MESIKTILRQAIGETISSLSLKRLSGGSINQTYHVSLPGGRNFFCKIHSSQDCPGLFEKEKRGLERLAAEKIFRIPRVIASADSGTEQVLILEWIQPSPVTNKFWNCFGQQLAALHQVNSGHFGLEEDNFMGALPQSNRLSASWTRFFVEERLEPQLRMAADRQLLPSGIRNSFENLYKRLDGIFPVEKPSLLHGDLWSGNFLSTDPDTPVLIDPAIYFGHRSMDLAMTTLFGGFEQAFYDAYAYHIPFAPNYREQWAICNLYPLLIHLNLFGRSYLAPILETIRPFQNR